MSFVIESLRSARRRYHAAQAYFIKPKLVRPASGATPRGRVLLAYNSGPFKSSARDFAHSNNQESRAIADLFAAQGYDVDVIDFWVRSAIDYDRYNVMIGFGELYDRSFDHPTKCVRIFLATGANPWFNDSAEAARIRYFKERHGRTLAPRRFVNRGYASTIVVSDAIFCLGNQWTLDTYAPYQLRLFRVPVSVAAHFDFDAVDAGKDYQAARRRFLWFGSSGSLHKGLDLVLDAMDELPPEFELHVCGPVNHERDFFEFYRKHLTGRSNIHFHGMMDVRSEAMQNILRSCGSVLFPSCAEGGGAAALTCMYSGLAPIVTRGASVDADGFGIWIPPDQETPAGVAAAMQQAAGLGADELRSRAAAAAAFVRANHTLDVYRRELHRALAQMKLVNAPLEAQNNK